MKHDLTDLKRELFDAPNTVYLKPVEPDEVQRIVPAAELADIDDLTDIFALHTSDGVRVALVEGREAAIAAARAHALQPFSVH